MALLSERQEDNKCIETYGGERWRENDLTLGDASASACVLWYTRDESTARTDAMENQASRVPSAKQLKEKWIVYCQRSVRIRCALNERHCEEPPIQIPGKTCSNYGITFFFLQFSSLKADYVLWHEKIQCFQKSLIFSFFSFHMCMCFFFPLPTLLRTDYRLPFYKV